MNVTEASAINRLWLLAKSRGDMPLAELLAFRELAHNAYRALKSGMSPAAVSEEIDKLDRQFIPVKEATDGTPEKA